jgi:tRNA threonylcarbamoyladenosine biosynthesis protein TsaB
VRILAFDCAGAHCAAAIVVDSAVVAVRRIAADRGHAQSLLPLLQDALAEAGLDFGDIDRFAVTTGPGSFTGIRVALAAARGLALGTGKPAVGVTVFDAIAAQVAGNGIAAERLLVAIESRRATLFLQLYDAAARPLGGPAMLAPDGIADWLGPGSVSLAGDAAWRVAANLGNRVLPLDSAPAFVDPAILAMIAAARATGASPAPFYIREPDARPNPAR